MLSCQSTSRTSYVDKEKKKEKNVELERTANKSSKLKQPFSCIKEQHKHSILAPPSASQNHWRPNCKAV